MRASSVVLAGVLLLALNSYAQTPDQGVVTGRVVAASSGLPLASARVEGDQATFTDAEGRFQLPAGRATALTVSKPGYLRATVSVGVQTSIGLTRAGAISGRLTDASGDPARGRRVTAELRLPGGDARVVATTQSDDRGEYRLSGLPEGRYYIGIRSTAPPPPVREPPPAQVYYPGQDTPQAVTAGAGEERSAIDVAIPAEQFIRLGPEPPAPRRTGRASVRGSVVTSDGIPVANVSVRLIRERLESDGPVRVGSRTETTDAQGRFAFLQVDAGTHYVSAVKTGFITTEFGQARGSESGEPIDVRETDALDGMNVTLPRLAAITGRVVDGLGEPIEAANIRVMQIRYAGGARRLVDVTAGRFFLSDDRGLFRVFDLAPGEYIVAAAVGQLARRSVAGVGNGIAAPTVDLPGYATTFYPGTANPGEAMRVTVDDGVDVPGIDIALMRAPTARIAGRVVDADGNPLSAGLILAPSRRSGVLAAAPVAADIDDDGNFEFGNVAPGEYVIQASISGRGPFDEGESASQFVTVSGTDLDGVLVRLTRGSTARGRIVIQAATAPDAGLFSVDLRAMPVDMDLTPQNLEVGPASAQIEADGTFVLEGLSGLRVFRLQSPRWALQSVTVNGVEVTDTPVMFGADDQSIEGVEVVLTERVATVAGQASDLRGRGVANARVILVPADRTRWGETSRFMASVLTNRSGSFTIPNVLPGEYYAVAVIGVDAEEWRDPDLLDSLAPLLTLVTVGDQNEVTVPLRVR